jgi:hypothetical protein
MTDSMLTTDRRVTSLTNGGGVSLPTSGVGVSSQTTGAVGGVSSPLEEVEITSHCWNHELTDYNIGCGLTDLWRSCEFSDHGSRREYM